MKFNKQHIVTMLKSSVFALGLLAVPMLGLAHSVTNAPALEFATPAEKDNADKNITNVKVIFNPIAQQITVSFKLGKQSSVSVKLMDALGNEVLNLSNSVLDQGLQTLSFDIEGKVSPGFYFVRVTSGTETVVKRISVR